MSDEIARPKIQEEPKLMIALGVAAILACVTFIVSILFADFVVPDHD